MASVNVDTTMSGSHPNDPRWDYVIWYRGKEPYLPCVEVHPADSSHVDEVIAKKNWLEGLVRGATSPRRRYYWVPTASVSLYKSSVGWRKLAESGITMRRIVFLDDA
jgi:hypothetical protein